MVAMPLAAPWPYASASAEAAETLVSRARRGDEGAFRQIYDQHVAAVRRFLRDILNDRSRVEDAVQETFVRAFLRIGTLREGEKLLPWLLGISRRVSREHRRSFRRLIPMGLIATKLFRNLTHRHHRLEETPESHLLRSEIHRAITDALSRTSQARMEALLLRVDHGLSCAQVADVMGWSVPKVKVELFRARQQLRRFLAPYRESMP